MVDTAPPPSSNTSTFQTFKETHHHRVADKLQHQNQTNNTSATSIPDESLKQTAAPATANGNKTDSYSYSYTYKKADDTTGES